MMPQIDLASVITQADVTFSYHSSLLKLHK